MPSEIGDARCNLAQPAPRTGHLLEQQRSDGQAQHKRQHCQRPVTQAVRTLRPLLLLLVLLLLARNL